MKRVSKTMGVLLCAILVLSAAPVVAQSTLDGYAATNGVPGGPTDGGTPGPVTTEGNGFLTIFTDQMAFQTAAPGLPKEDFEAGQVAPGGVVACPAPCTDTGGCAGCFNPGDLETGLSIDNGPLSDPIQGLVLIGAGGFGNPSIVIVANTFTDFFIMNFSVPVNAVGFDTVSYIPQPEPVVIEVFTTSGSQGTFNVNATNAGTFWGVISTDPAELITSITIFAPAGGTTTNGAEGVDNLCFGFVVQGESDLSVSKEGTITGNQVTFTISVTNNGPDDATDVVVTDMLDAAVTYVSDDCGGTIMGQDWTWNVGNLANGATAVCNLVGTVAAGTTAVPNTATASATQDDPNTANNSATTTAFPNALAIPTLGTLGLVALILALAGLALLLLMHRRRTA